MDRKSHSPPVQLKHEYVTLTVLDLSLMTSPFAEPALTTTECPFRPRLVFGLGSFKRSGVPSPYSNTLEVGTFMGLESYERSGKTRLPAFRPRLLYFVVCETSVRLNS